MGWNWGRDGIGAVLNSMALQLPFAVGNHTAFEIPLNNVSQCTNGKNEVTLEFHQVGVLLYACNVS